MLKQLWNKKYGVIGVLAGVLAFGILLMPKQASAAEISVQRMKISKTSITACESRSGERELLSLQVFPANATECIKWRSSNLDVAAVERVNAVGKQLYVHLKKAGKTVITASVKSGASVSCQVTITKQIRLNQPDQSLYLGERLAVRVVHAPGSITWNSYVPSVASVSQNGMVTAKKVGTTLIEAVSKENGSANCLIKVKAPKAIPVKPAPVIFWKKGKAPESRMEYGRQIAWKRYVQTIPANAAIQYQSSNKKVLTVNRTGTVKAVGYGSAVLKASLKGGNSKQIRITVVSARSKGKK